MVMKEGRTQQKYFFLKEHKYFYIPLVSLSLFVSVSLVQLIGALYNIHRGGSLNPHTLLLQI